MRTNDDGNPDFADILESGRVEIGRYARLEADGFGIVIDGAVESVPVGSSSPPLGPGWDPMARIGKCAPPADRPWLRENGSPDQDSSTWVLGQTKALEVASGASSDSM
jgi:hypothetical protein